MEAELAVDRTVVALAVVSGDAEMADRHLWIPGWSVELHERAYSRGSARITLGRAAS